MPYETLTLAISPSTLELGADVLEYMGKNGSVHATLNIWEGEREEGIIITCETMVGAKVLIAEDCCRLEWKQAIAESHSGQANRPRWVHVTNITNGETEYWDVEDREDS
jgi:hypothetical protein